MDFRSASCRIYCGLRDGFVGLSGLLVVLSQGSMAFWIFEASGSVRFGEACCGSRRSLNPRR